ncbi:hypothetical protein [Bacillus sp. FJAT-50079]|nr:hypothetical protein [Bacillus sp. FJAT-50079]MBS4209233.1 hypothetical protein [Bacillus sp. FJAT-50079]
MDLWVTLCLLAVLGSIALFLCYFISGALDFDDAKRVDKARLGDFDDES